MEEKEHLNYVINNIHNTIDYMYEELDKINIEYIKTQANFIMINVNRSSKEIVLELLKKGYIVRDGFPLMENWIRVSIGTKEEMSGFVNALKEVI